jgi:hypothetical protein
VVGTVVDIGRVTVGVVPASTRSAALSSIGGKAASESLSAREYPQRNHHREI